MTFECIVSVGMITYRLDFGYICILLYVHMYVCISKGPDAMVACTAINPADRPINFTMPMPLGRLQRASVFADKMAAWAASTEVVKPKDLQKTNLILQRDFKTLINSYSFYQRNTTTTKIPPINTTHHH